ncbi:MAG: glycoside hydrolase family 16 protein, partial [Candidatus Saccharimonadales bacterium]
YVDAFLLWPENDSNWKYAESDFPNMNLNDSGTDAFAHYGGSGAQDYFRWNGDISQWHTYEQDWTPTSRSYYVDGTLIGTSTNQVWNQPERFQLQTEPTGITAGDTGHQLVDWVAIYSSP